MNCREYIIEFEERGTLSEPATLHLTICADCKKLSEQQTRVWLMIDDLKPVAAPNNFDFHVKARIAQAKPSDFQSPRFLPILRYALPLSVVILLLGLFAYNSTYFSGSQTAPQTAQNITETPTVSAVLPDDLPPTNQLAFAESDEQKPILAPPSSNDSPANNKRNAERLSKTRVPILKTSIDTDSGGGSHIFSSSSATNNFTPAGINFKNVNSADAPKLDNQKPIDEGETLTIIGIKFVTENGRRTVETVQENSIAAKSGVQAGDVIEKINDGALTVLRGTEKLEITLRSEFSPKP